jgi:hypothetical protein
MVVADGEADGPADDDKGKAEKVAEPEVEVGKDEPPPASARWDAADKTVRETAKWIITTVTGFSGLVFASGGFLAKGDFSEQYFWQRACVMVASAGAAALGLAGLIGYIARTIAPDEPTLDKLPEVIVTDIELAPSNYFPEGIQTMTDFKRRYVVWFERAANLKIKAAETESALKAAMARTPKVAEEVARLELEHRALVAAHAKADISWASFREARDLILSRARYSNARRSFADAGWPLALCGMVLVVGAATYLVAASFKPTPPKDAPSAERPVLAQLTKGDSSASDKLWTAAGLDACETEPGVTPVLLESGDGTDESPWKLRTIAGVPEGCASVGFSVISAVATVVVPDAEVKITYETEEEEEDEEEDTGDSEDTTSTAAD